jgi:glycosyltransferase involved in cell wall biosynthesis
MTPVVSVVVSTRNRADLLPRALSSIASQTLRDFECIVVDDGSTEETLAAYRRLISDFGARFRVDQTFPPNSAGTGPGSAKNRGIQAARGEYLTFLDDDDWWIAPDHLEVAVDCLRRFGADYFFSNRQGVRQDVVIIDDWYSRSPQLMHGPRLRADPPVYEVSLRTFCDAMGFRMPHPGNLITTRELANAAGGFLERTRWMEDYDFCLRLADRASGILYRPSVTTAARMPDGDSVSLAESAIRQQLDSILVTQHVRRRSRRSEIRRCARAREAWILRELADTSDSVPRLYRLSLAWQALTLYPTLGALRCLVRCLSGIRPKTTMDAANPARTAQA